MNISRRQFGAVTLAAVLPSLPGPARAEDAGRTRATAYAFSFKALGDGAVRLADYVGKPVLVVNTASLCGFTPQYAGLQELYARYRARGFAVIGVPSNDFGGQEPGGEAEIDHTAHGQFGVTFPMTAKTGVKGPAAHPFYRWVLIERPFDPPRWNFHKYLVGKDGHIAGSFPAQIEPLDARVTGAIERELGAS